MKAHLFLLPLALVLAKADIWNNITADLLGDRVQSGNYAISLCGSAQPDSLASTLLTTLPYIWQQLQNVLVDVELGTASKHGFRSIFKSNKNKSFVRSVFHAIAEGGNITRKTGKPSDTFLNPTIICLNPNSEIITNNMFYDYFCVNDAAATRWTAASTEPDTNFVVLCPPFWHLRLGLTDDACPSVVGTRRRRRLEPNDDALMESKYAVLLHELVHLYNPFEPSAEVDIDEKYLIQDLVDLDAAEALANAQSYTAYAAAVQAGCIQWPMTPTKREDDLKV
ncbi:MAG: hypothetical protein Q9225_002939 [Loekoesia sp. 1 TL-2023]